MSQEPLVFDGPLDKSKRYVVRYFDDNWEESYGLTYEGSIVDAILNVAIWARSREIDANDTQVIVFSIYHNYPYCTIEEISHGEEKRESTKRKRNPKKG